MEQSTHAARKTAIAAATLDQAREWIDTPDRFTHCLHVLGMDDAPDGEPDAIRWAGALEGRSVPSWRPNSAARCPWTR